MVEQNPYEIRLDDLDGGDAYAPAPSGNDVPSRLADPAPLAPKRVGGASAEPNPTAPPALDVGPVLRVDDDADEYAAEYDAKAIQKLHAGEGLDASKAADGTLKKVLMRRLAISVLAVVLLWLSSFGVARGIASALVQSPQPEEVFKAWEAAVKISLDQRSAFEDCGTSEVGFCNARLNATITATTQTLAIADALNIDTLDSLNTITSACADKLATKILGLRLWQEFITALDLSRTFGTRNTTQIVFFNSESVCDNRSRADLEALGIQGNAVAVEGTSLSLGFLSDYEQFFRESEAAVNARIAYDTEFLANQTGILGAARFNLVDAITFPALPDIGGLMVPKAPNISVLLGCAGIENEGCIGGLGASLAAARNQAQARFDRVQQAAEFNFVSANQTITAMAAEVSRLRTYVNSTINFVANVDATIQQVGLGAKSFPDFQSDLVKLPSLSAALPSLDLSAIPRPTNLSFDLGASTLVNTANRSLSALANNAQVQLNDMTLTATAGVNNVFISLNQSLAAAKLSVPNLRGFDLLTDYNPPPVDFSGINTGREASQDTFLSSQSELLSQAQGGSSNTSVLQSNITAPEVVDVGETQSANSKELQGFSFQGFDFNDLFDLIPKITGLVISFDIVYRVFTTVRILVRYGTMSGVGLPDIDVRKWKTTSASQRQLDHKIASCLTSPVTIVFMAVVLVALFISGVNSIYVPLLKHYIAGCATIPPGGLSANRTAEQSTILSRNTKAIFFNVASGSGAKVIVDGVESYDKLRVNLCTDLTKSATDANANAQGQAALDVNRFQQIAESMDKVERCISPVTFFQYGDSEVITQLYVNSFIPFANNPLLPTTERFSLLTDQISFVKDGLTNFAFCGATGLNSLSPIQPVVFNCSADEVPLCDNICTAQPNLKVIDDSTHRAACFTEWLFHSAVIKMLLTVVTYVCWQIARTLLIGGLGRLFWRSLTPYGFNFLGSCDRQGRPYEYQEFLTAELKRKLAGFERMAYVFFFLTFLANLPWIVLMALFSTNLTYYELQR